MKSDEAAQQALELLFKKLHPHLEDAAHALKKGADTTELLRLHKRLFQARYAAMLALEAWVEQLEDPELIERLDTLAANLTPLGETYQQSLTVTQLCLEEAPAELLPFASEGCVASSGWGKRMVAFLSQLKDPAFEARQRWRSVDPEVGDDPEEGAL